MFVLEQEDQELYDRIQEQNLNRQYELLTNCIEIGLKKGAVAFDKYMLWAVCTENLILIDYVTESPSINGDDRAALLLPDPVRLAAQVEEPT
jgi:hypothetical protein